MGKSLMYLSVKDPPFDAKGWVLSQAMKGLGLIFVILLLTVLVMGLRKIQDNIQEEKYQSIILPMIGIFGIFSPVLIFVLPISIFPSMFATFVSLFALVLLSIICIAISVRENKRSLMICIVCMVLLIVLFLYEMDVNAEMIYYGFPVAR